MRIVQQLNRCIEERVTRNGHHFMVTEIGGDWKYIREAFEMRSHWNSSKMCHLCQTPRLCMTDLSDDLPWRDLANFCEEILPTNNNWSPLVLLRNFHPTLITWCLLHTVYLGLLWTANGASLAYLLELGRWGNPSDINLKLRLRLAYVSFQAWLKRYKISSSQRVFKPRMLFKSGHGAYLSAKGFNSRCLAAWLADESKEHLDSYSMDAPEELVLQTRTMLL